MSITEPTDDGRIASDAPENVYMRDRSIAARLRSIERMAQSSAVQWPRSSIVQTEQQAKIFEEVETGLRRMVDAQFCGAAPEVAPPQPQEQDGAFADAPAPPIDPARWGMYAPAGTGLQESFDELKPLPGFLVAPGAANIAQDPDQWPPLQAPRRNRAVPLLMRFGMAAAGAAVVLMFAAQDVRTFVQDNIGAKLTPRASNAAVAMRDQNVVAEQTRQAAAEATAALGQKLAVARSDALPRSGSAEEGAINQSAPAPEVRTEAIPSVPLRVLSADDIAILRKQGDAYVAVGDFAGARVVLQRAAEAGDAAAALALGATFDPVVLSRFGVKGLAPDSAKAALWYDRARALGLTNAPRHLNAMARGD